MDKIFLIDENTITYNELIDYINGQTTLIQYNELELFFLNTIKNLIPRKVVEDYDDLIKTLYQQNKSIELLTSGTTGEPKVVYQSFKNMVRNIKVSEARRGDVWGMFYQPVRMAGYQVLFQALLNKNTLVNMFRYDFSDVQNRILTYNVTHLSATPTLYKMIISKDIVFDKVKQLTLGGEGSTESFQNMIREYFPNARLKNIYASTEAGSLFASSNDAFHIPEKYMDKIKIVEDVLWIHESILGQSSSIDLDNGWYNTGDLVTFVNKNSFKILGRSSNVVKIAGYNVNVESVEMKIHKLDFVKYCRVYSEENSLLGNILICELVPNQSIELKEAKSKIKEVLEKYEVPTKIKFVESIELSENGKIKR